MTGQENGLSREMIGQMIDLAVEMMQRAYAPYSHFTVGAALLTKAGKLYGGCNVENAAYSPGSCAERTAICKAVSEGEREFRAIAIVGGREAVMDGYCPPCGVCRQVMREFCDPESFRVILATGREEYKIMTLQELLPESFGPDNL
ncbi:MAG: cytidine deaminase [Lachnospiraceae bacterium]